MYVSCRSPGCSYVLNCASEVGCGLQFDSAAQTKHVKSCTVHQKHITPTNVTSTGPVLKLMVANSSVCFMEEFYLCTFTSSKIS